ncbi:MAG: hypothetical protein K0R90_1379 [Oscillospiraceae bacterium]|nr:hypothetical protein [Oscillospiraceae bacterium]
MIKAKFKQLNGRYVGFCISGHAGYNDYGNDIVCASVTSAVQLTANGITEVIGMPAKIAVEENEISFLLPDGCDSQCAFVLLSALHLHLSVLSQDYEGTIQLSDVEV